MMLLAETNRSWRRKVAKFV